MPTGHDDSEFEGWFDATFSLRNWPLERVDALRAWARELFASIGPVERDVVRVAADLEKLAAVGAALELVIADLRIVSGRVPATTAGVYDGGLRVTVDGGYSEGAIFLLPPYDVAEVAVEIVEYIRAEVCDDPTVSFPVCSRHERFYLHPALEKGVAVWRCNRGNHVVAAIGQLGSAER